MAPIDRMVFFRVAPEKVDVVIKQYATLKRDAVKASTGTPYILAARARRLHPDTPNRGFTVVAQTQFANLEDVKYYNEECEAHRRLKEVVGPLVIECAGTVPEGMMIASVDGDE